MAKTFRHTLKKTQIYAMQTCPWTNNLFHGNWMPDAWTFYGLKII
jgi:hypothetical protein